MKPPQCNVGWIERSVRLLLGLPTATAYLYVRHFSDRWSYALLAGGLSLVASAAYGWCPVHWTVRKMRPVSSPLAEPSSEHLA